MHTTHAHTDTQTHTPCQGQKPLIALAECLTWRLKRGAEVEHLLLSLHLKLKLFSIKTIQVCSIFEDRKGRKPMCATCSTGPVNIVAVFQAASSPACGNEADLTSIPPNEATDEARGGGGGGGGETDGR